MIPTPRQVFDGVRGLLGDTATAGGAKFTNAYLRRESFAPMAYRDAYRVLQEQNIGKIQRRLHYVLPAYQSVLAPAAANISNFGDPISIREMDFLASNHKDVTGATVNTNDHYTDLTVAGHGRADGDVIFVYGVQGLSDDVNASWRATFPDVNTVRLLGCEPSGTYTASTGKIVWSSDVWSGVLDRVDVRELQSSGGSTALGTGLTRYAWEDDIFRFDGATVARLLEIHFQLSGNFPSQDNASLGIDDVLDYMQYRAAALVATRYDPQLSATYDAIAIGPARDLNREISGLLGLLVGPQIRDKQKQATTRRPFRQRRPRDWMRARVV
jgi:hypothetical protein